MDCRKAKIMISFDPRSQIAIIWSEKGEMIL